jgi:hypothetical protein
LAHKKYFLILFGLFYFRSVKKEKRADKTSRNCVYRPS